MASAVACKDAAPASLLKSGAPVAFCPLSTTAITADRRPYNTLIKEAIRYDDDDDRNLVLPSLFSQDVFDPLGAPTGIARLLSQTGLSSTAGASRLGRWVAKEDDGAVYLKVPMPGLTKEHVQVRADKNILVIKGEGEKQPWDGDNDSAVPRYNHRIEIPADAYKMDKIKAEMKNGMLWVTLLKLEEERKDVFHVKVE
ncbi:26.2 kDa heat shock protein, mitochondrial-like [Hordeum vulgare subsp. vulgare]|uniref:26.2 kDa heat shock protein, mitochondrial-like n=1 Tax=Hordeum vulgare subsp. vulgare TaxID=112509 RepID=UPI001B857AAB|nr:26.2 kDa heat shock protein, mitochondrial-like [Hordeum vulgare subsp. vulgare]